MRRYRPPSNPVRLAPSSRLCPRGIESAASITIGLSPPAAGSCGEHQSARRPSAHLASTDPRIKVEHCRLRSTVYKVRPIAILTQHNQACHEPTPPCSDSSSPTTSRSSNYLGVRMNGFADPA